MPDALNDARPWVLAADHPAFAGHFPGEPILPGVAILAAVLDAIGTRAGLSGRSHWRVAKFHSPARPGDALLIALTRRAGDQFAYSVTAGERLVADGLVAIDHDDGPGPATKPVRRP